MAGALVWLYRFVEQSNLLSWDQLIQSWPWWEKTPSYTATCHLRKTLRAWRCGGSGRSSPLQCSCTRASERERRSRWRSTGEEQPLWAKLSAKGAWGWSYTTSQPAKTASTAVISKKADPTTRPSCTWWWQVRPFILFRCFFTDWLLGKVFLLPSGPLQTSRFLPRISFKQGGWLSPAQGPSEWVCSAKQWASTLETYTRNSAVTLSRGKCLIPTNYSYAYLWEISKHLPQ